MRFRDLLTRQVPSSRLGDTGMERVTGFEPARSAWKAEMLTVEHHTRKVSPLGPQLFTDWEGSTPVGPDVLMSG